MNFARLLPSLTVAALLCMAPAVAQNANPSPAPQAPAPAPPHHMNAMRAALASLNLSDAQKTQIQNIIAQARAARENGEPVSHADLLKQINAVLTPAQRTQLQTAIEKAKAARQQPPPAQ